jgi:chromate reductase, NAD(P)H dehydrogenase (quinone)
MKVLVMAASLRKESLHKKLAVLVARELGALEGVSAELVQFNDFEMPLYNFDVQQEGFPAGADALKAALEGVDAVVFAVPEYNYSIPGAFKNAIDWLSRYKQNPLKHKPVMLMGGSPGPIGGQRGLWQTRIPIEAQLAFVHPEMIGISNMGDAFNEQGDMAEEFKQKKLVATLDDFCKWAAKLG